MRRGEQLSENIRLSNALMTLVGVSFLLLRLLVRLLSGLFS
jgi:hypothetical protein